MNPKAPLRLAAAFFSLFAGCAGSYSLREHAIRSQVPEEFRNHNSGIVAQPRDEDIQAALSLGTDSKDGDALDYAYLMKAPRGFFAADDVYVKVATPLYLIADHARERARQYREVDQDFVKFARDLRAVRISVAQQYISTATWNAYAFSRQVVLLRDGVRVDPLDEVPAWEGQNPFADKPGKQMEAALSGVNQAAAQASRGFAINMTQEQKQQLLRSYRSMGLSEEQMTAYTGFTREEIRGILEEDANETGATIVLTDFDAVFPVDELTKPGQYELVFRTPETASLFASGDKEIRFPISFAGFR